MYANFTNTVTVH